MDELISLLERFGFPIFMCSWFMLRYEKLLDKMSARMHRLVVLNTVLVKSLDAAEFEAELDTFEDED